MDTTEGFFDGMEGFHKSSGVFWYNFCYFLPGR